MKVNIDDMEISIDFSDEMINILCVENKKNFFEVLSEFVKIEQGLSDNDKIKFINVDEEINVNKKIAVFSDYFNIEFNSKKILGSLYETIECNLNEQSFTDMQMLLDDIIRLYNGYISNIDLDLEYNNQIGFVDLCKLLKLQIKDDTTMLIDKIQLIVDIESQLHVNKAIIFNNLLQYLNEEERKKLYEQILAKKVCVLFIENVIVKKIENFEKIYLIDKDFDECII